MTSSVRAKMAQVEKEKKVARREAMANPEVYMKSLFTYMLNGTTKLT